MSQPTRQPSSTLRVITIIGYALSVLGTLFLFIVWWFGGISACVGVSGPETCRSLYDGFQWGFLALALLVPLALFIWAMRSGNKRGPLTTALIVELALPVALFTAMAILFSSMY